MHNPTMSGKPRKSPREKDLTSRYLSGGMDEGEVEQEQFGARGKPAQQSKLMRTAAMRAEGASGDDINLLPVGQVVQVFSKYSEVEHEGARHLCVVRKTLTKVNKTPPVVGDHVRFRMTQADARQQSSPAGSSPEAVIEEVLPRQTVLTRADSFKGLVQHPIVANAEQMLIVACLRQPAVRWGLVDRMVIAARSGSLQPTICLNKIDLAEAGASDLAEARAVLSHYNALDVKTLQTSVTTGEGIAELRELLAGRVTVLAGHSGVGKSSLIRSIQPQLDLRVGEVSAYTDKGRHTTTSARRYVLDYGGAVIDTPGVKVFGLWGVTHENLLEFFPDLESGTAPPWRRESYDRIAASIAGAS